MRAYFRKIYWIIILILLIPGIVRSAMSSTNYYIYADSISDGGGISEGGDYTVESTIGGISSAGTGTGGSYELRGGYQYMERGYITLSMDDSSLDLGTMTLNATSEASTTVTVDTDSSTGYSLTVDSFSGTLWNSVSGGTVDAGSQEFGLITSGSDSQVNNYSALSNGLILASTSTVVNAPRSTVLTFKAAISSATLSGSYSQAIVLSAYANL